MRTALYQPQEHSERIAALRRARWTPCAHSFRFHPYLTGPVLKGTAGPYAEIELQLSADTQDVEIDLLERGVSFSTQEAAVLR